MKAVILAGGKGTRISEESLLRPKPMVEIGGMPLLWHIMKIYSYYGINDFVICLGYKGYIIKEYFSNYFLHMSDVTFDMKENKIEVHQNKVEPWRVTLVETGSETMTGGRLLRVKKYIGNETFCMTYGDGLSNVNILKLLAFHKNHEKLATLTVIHQPSRFGLMDFDGDLVKSFREKSVTDGNWINGGFFALEPDVFDLIADESTVWEKEPLEKLAAEQNLCAYKHEGFWHCVDALRDHEKAEELWQKEKPPWKVWE